MHKQRKKLQVIVKNLEIKEDKQIGYCTIKNHCTVTYYFLNVFTAKFTIPKKIPSPIIG